MTPPPFHNGYFNLGLDLYDRAEKKVKEFQQPKYTVYYFFS